MDSNSVIHTLETYKKLTEEQGNQNELLKEKTVILYVATLLESRNITILDLCLSIVENFMRNDKSHNFLLGTLGIFEALASLAIRLRHSESSLLAQRATEIIDILRSSAPPAYSTRNRSKRNRTIKTTFVFLLHIEELTTDNRHQLDEALVEIKGLISFVVDAENKRCTVRIGPKITIRQLVVKINKISGLKPYLVTNIKHNESLVNILEEDNTKCIAEYYPEIESPQAPNAFAMKTNTEDPDNPNNSFLKSVKTFLSNSFYW